MEKGLSEAFPRARQSYSGIGTWKGIRTFGGVAALVSGTEQAFFRWLGGCATTAVFSDTVLISRYKVQGNRQGVSEHLCINSAWALGYAQIITVAIYFSNPCVRISLTCYLCLRGFTCLIPVLVYHKRKVNCLNHIDLGPSATIR